MVKLNIVIDCIRERDFLVDIFRGKQDILSLFDYAQHTLSDSSLLHFKWASWPEGFVSCKP